METASSDETVSMIRENTDNGSWENAGDCKSKYR